MIIPIEGNKDNPPFLALTSTSIYPTSWLLCPKLQQGFHAAGSKSTLQPFTTHWKPWKQGSRTWGMELMGPEPSSIRSPNARLQIRLKKKKEIPGYSWGSNTQHHLWPSCTEHALEGSFLPCNHSPCQASGDNDFFFLFIVPWKGDPLSFSHATSSQSLCFYLWLKVLDRVRAQRKKGRVTGRSQLMQSTVWHFSKDNQLERICC